MRSLFCLGTVLLLVLACTTRTGSRLPPPETVAHVDLKRYAGDWFEIARYTHRFQKGCVDSRASYRLRDDGTIGVRNSCMRDGRLDTATGVARVADPATNARLKVSFFRPFWGDYWIIDLGDDYEYAVVSAPNRKYLWILSRTPRMDPALYDAITSRLRTQGFDISRLEQAVTETR